MVDADSLQQIGYGQDFVNRVSQWEKETGRRFVVNQDQGGSPKGKKKEKRFVVFLMLAKRPIARIHKGAAAGKKPAASYLPRQGRAFPLFSTADYPTRG